MPSRPNKPASKPLSAGILNAIKTRRSIRKFKDKPVPEKDILKIIEAASMAPSASNRQNWSFVIVSKNATKEKMRTVVEEAVKKLLSKTASKSARDKITAYLKYFIFFHKAPVVICAVEKPYDSLIHRLTAKCDYNGRLKSVSGTQNVAAAIENLLLAAHALGYGACWMSGPLIAREELSKILKIHPPDNLAALIPLGIPNTAPPPPPRPPVKKIVRFM